MVITGDVPPNLVATVYSFVQEVNRKYRDHRLVYQSKDMTQTKKTYSGAFGWWTGLNTTRRWAGWNTTRWMNDKREGVLEERTDYVKVR